MVKSAPESFSAISSFNARNLSPHTAGISINEQAYEPDHPTLAVSYSNLATIEMALGDLPAARDLMQRAIAIDEKAYEPDHPNLAVSYWILGRIEEDDGNIDQARVLIERAHAIFLHRLGPEHPETQKYARWLSKDGGPS
jgi:tetratricopeptide (TPR) repeat protein